MVHCLSAFITVAAASRAIPTDRMVAVGILSPFSFHHSRGDLVEGMRIVDSTPMMSDKIKAPYIRSKFCALHISPNDLAGFFARRIGGKHEEPWLHILLGSPEAVGLNPEQRKAVEMRG
jgi:hypothetical protein